MDLHILSVPPFPVCFLSLSLFLPSQPLSIVHIYSLKSHQHIPSLLERAQCRNSIGHTVDSLCREGEGAGAYILVLLDLPEASSTSNHVILLGWLRGLVLGSTVFLQDWSQLVLIGV